MAFVPLSFQSIFDSGFPIVNARLYTFEAGTVTPRTLYRTAALDPTLIHPFPVQADGNGRFPAMFTGVGSYDARITDATDALVAEADGLAGDPTPSGNATVYDPLRQLPTGALVPIHGTGRRAGYVRANGSSIGSAASAGVERADDDCYPLFLLLWADSHQTVAGGRGQTAQDDWDAGKTITVPDYQGRVVLGALNMGNAGSATGRLDGGKLATSSGSVDVAVGATGGEAAHQLSKDEMPLHRHDASVAIQGAGGHSHSSSIGQAGQHNHNVIYRVDNVYGSGANGAVGAVGQGPSSGVTELSGNHTHPITIDGVPDHIHGAAAAVADTGGDQRHNTLPPFGVATIYIKL
ncbi:hypothetical protein [Methylobacterium sp. Gmos1]